MRFRDAPLPASSPSKTAWILHGTIILRRHSGWNYGRSWLVCTTPCLYGYMYERLGAGSPRLVVELTCMSRVPKAVCVVSVRHL